MTRPNLPTLFDALEPDREAVVCRQPHRVVREVRCKTLLNRCHIEDYSFNAYTGCDHGCVYCYARFMQRFHPHAEPWGTFVDVKINAPEVMVRQVRRLAPGWVFVSSACDGWQGVEADYQLTRRCCRILLDVGFRLGILTKNDRVLRDLDIFEGRPVRLGVTLTTLDEATARMWEPGASPVARRIEVLRRAHEAGMETAVMFGPLLPGLSDSDEALANLFAVAAEQKVDHIWTDALNARPRVWPSVQGFLQTYRPDLLPLYRRVLFDATYRSKYVAELRGRIRRAAMNAGVTDRTAGCED